MGEKQPLDFVFWCFRSHDRNANLFHKYIPSSKNLMVRIVDGSLSKVGVGSIVITDNIILHSVLLVSKLTCNLLSISKLIKDLNCITIFFPNHCKFQNLEPRRIIGNVKECVRLYLLKGPNNPRSFSLSYSLYGNQRPRKHSLDLYWWEFDTMRNWAKTGFGCIQQ